MILQLPKRNHTIETHVGLQKNAPLQTDIFVENRPSQKETIVLLLMEKNPPNSPVEVSCLSHYLQGFVHPFGGWPWDFRCGCFRLYIQVPHRTHHLESPKETIARLCISTPGGHDANTCWCIVCLYIQIVREMAENEHVSFFKAKDVLYQDE